MPSTPVPIAADRSETAFADEKKPLTGHQAVEEANRCLYCYDAPCIQGCPTRVDVPEFIRKISTGNLKGAARSVLSVNVLGASCARVCPTEVLCVQRCVLSAAGSKPIRIGALQRYVAELAVEGGWHLFEAGADTGKSVGLVGAGPASLAAAHALRRCGHRCTLYERKSVAGGLNAWAIAPYKLKVEDAVRELQWLSSIGGIDFQLDVAVGRDLSWSDLQQRHDAIFIGIGLGQDRRLGVDGEDLDGVRGALAFIERMKLARVDLDGVREAVVVGGGNTAIDAVRELLGLGVPRVTMVYRRSRSDKSGYEHEWEAALAAGARAEWRALPVAILGSGRVEQVRCVRLDAERRPMAGSEFVIGADLVLMAIGQQKLSAGFEGLEGVCVEGGRMVVDAHGFTGRPGVYAGGDCVNGGKEVVNAVAEGHRAAHAIDRALRGGPHA